MAADRRGWFWTSIPLDQPVMLALAPAVGYLVAYLDRLGEAVALGVPVDYISISTTDALSRVSLVLVALVVMLTVSRLEANLAGILPNWAREPLSTLSTWLFIAALALVLAWQARLALIALAFGVFWAAAHAGLAYLRRDKSPRSEEQATVSDGPVLLKRAASEREPIRIRAALVVVLVLAALFFAFVGGNVRASTRETHLLLSRDESVVVLAIYGEKVVLGDLQDDSGALGETRELTAVSEVPGVYKWATTGPLVWEEGFAILPISVFTGSRE